MPNTGSNRSHEARHTSHRGGLPAVSVNRQQSTADNTGYFCGYRELHVVPPSFPFSSVYNVRSTSSHLTIDQPATSLFWPDPASPVVPPHLPSLVVPALCSLASASCTSGSLVGPDPTPFSPLPATLPRPFSAPSFPFLLLFFTILHPGCHSSSLFSFILGDPCWHCRLAELRPMDSPLGLWTEEPHACLHGAWDGGSTLDHYFHELLCLFRLLFGCFFAGPAGPAGAALFLMGVVVTGWPVLSTPVRAFCLDAQHA